MSEMRFGVSMPRAWRTANLINHPSTSDDGPPERAFPS